MSCLRTTIERTIVTVFALLACSIQQATHTEAQQLIDVPARINELLASAGQVRKIAQVPYQYNHCTQERCVHETDNCRCVKSEVRTATRAQQIMAPLRLAGRLEAKLGPVQWEKPYLTGLPSRVIRRGLKHYNCTPNIQTGSVTLTATWQSDESLSFQTTVSLQDQLGFNLTFAVPNSNTSASVSGSRTWSTGTTETSSNTRSHSFSATETVPRTVSPFSEQYTELIVTEDAFTIPFTVPIVVDGQVDSNLDGYTRLNQVLKDEKERTFVIKGVVQTVASSDTDVRQVEALLPKTCIAGSHEGQYDASPNLLGMNPDSKGILDDEAFSALIEAENAAIETNVEDTAFNIPLDNTSRPSADVTASSSQQQSGMRLFRAAGRHTCQSKIDIGHSCQVFGTRFTDCTQARLKLQQQDCCSNTRRIVPKRMGTGTEERFGGSSIGFIITSCTPF